MGEKQNQPLQLSFNPSLKVDFRGSRVTSDGGLLLVRELDERLGLSAVVAESVRDEELRKGPVGRPIHKPIVWYKGFLYQAASWKTALRVVAKVEFHAGELFPRAGFIVTNLETPSRAVVRFYNKRGTAEQWIKEGKQAVKMTRSLLPSVSLEPSRAGAEPADLQPGEFVTAAGVARRDRELVAHQLAATTGEDRRTSGQTCALLLAIAGRMTSDAAAVRGDAGSDCSARYRRDRKMVVSFAGESVYSVGVRGGVARLGHRWRNFDCAGSGFRTGRRRSG